MNVNNLDHYRRGEVYPGVARQYQTGFEYFRRTEPIITFLPQTYTDPNTGTPTQAITAASIDTAVVASSGVDSALVTSSGVTTASVANTGIGTATITSNGVNSATIT